MNTLTPQAQSSALLNDLRLIIDNAEHKAYVYLNEQACALYYRIGRHISQNLHYEAYADYGKSILATVSRTLTREYGRGYSYSALTRMVKVASLFPEETFATLSQTLSWSHFVELSSIEDPTRRLFYQQMSVAEHWSVRTLRSRQAAMAYERSLLAARPEEEIVSTLQEPSPEKHPDVVLKSSYILDFLGLTGYYSERQLEDAILHQLEQFILELGDGFAFVERQKRIPVDSSDYYLDLLFYHRKLNRLVAIDLKLGKFLPEYKGQMELYLRWLETHERQPHEQSPIGLLLCSEGNTEHIELMMLGESNIKVAQYLTQLPNKQWFIDKLNRSIAIAKQHRR